MRGCVATSSGEVRDTTPRRSKKPSARASKPKLIQPQLVEQHLPVRCNKTVRIDGRTFGASELCALCEAVEEEQDDGAAIDWYQVAEKLEAREASFDALLTLRRAATRLEDEARAARSSKKYMRSHSQPPQGRRKSDTVSSSSDDEEDDDAKWSPARCRVLWRWVAYARAPPESTLRSSDDDDDAGGDDDDVLDPWEFAYRARGAKAKKARFLDNVRGSFNSDDGIIYPPRSFSSDNECLQRPRGDSDASRLEDLTAAAMLCNNSDKSPDVDTRKSNPLLSSTETLFAGDPPSREPSGSFTGKTFPSAAPTAPSTTTTTTTTTTTSTSPALAPRPMMKPQQGTSYFNPPQPTTSASPPLGTETYEPPTPALVHRQATRLPMPMPLPPPPRLSLELQGTQRMPIPSVPLEYNTGSPVPSERAAELAALIQAQEQARQRYHHQRDLFGGMPIVGAPMPPPSLSAPKLRLAPPNDHAKFVRENHAFLLNRQGGGSPFLSDGRLTI